MSWPEIVHDLAISPPHSSMLSQAQKISTVSKLDQANGIGTTNRHRSHIQFATAAIMVSIFFPDSTMSMHTMARRKKKPNRSREKYEPFVRYVHIFRSLCVFFSLFLDYCRFVTEVSEGGSAMN